MKSVTAYLNFDGNCRPAMSYPDAKGQPSSDPAARIMHSQLSHNGAPILMASDTPPGGGSLTPGNNFSVSSRCDSLNEIERLFSALGQNGEVRLPLSNMPLGGAPRYAHGSIRYSLALQLRLAEVRGSGHDNQ